MKLRAPYYFILLSFVFCHLQCKDTKVNTLVKGPKALKVNSIDLGNNFKDYWYKGQAEITSYDLEQARYGEIHKGNAVMVFVTEPFSKSKLVKLDYPERSKGEALSVLKLNFTRKFNTGVYPYSTMQSIFTPVELKNNPYTLKVTTSSQEWCGHTFTQLSLRDKHYENLSYSYFESEGDQQSTLNKSLLEDEIWNRIRIAPKELPIGDIQLVPNTLASRLKHFTLNIEPAKAQLREVDDNKNHLRYEIKYQNIDRSLSVRFAKSFPHEIISWEETYTSGWGANAKKMVTKGKKKKSIMLDYWSKNQVSDLHYRKELGLE